MNARVEGKVALVTGGSQGLGKATAVMLAKEGASVAVTDILEDEGKSVVAEIQEAGGQAEFYKLDVTDEENVKTVFAEVRERFGPLTVLVNNAGISGADKPTDEFEVSEWNAVMAINVTGVFLCTKYVIPQMREAGHGSVINISSMYGLVGAPDVPAYHASKGAVKLMAKTDALLYASEKIRVNSVHPGFIWTPMVEDFVSNSGDAEGGREAVGSAHPLGHMGEPDDIAYGILYLASEESKFVTGSELVIDGGYTAR